MADKISIVNLLPTQKSSEFAIVYQRGLNFRKDPENLKNIQLHREFSSPTNTNDHKHNQE